MRIAYVAPYVDDKTMRGGVGRKISSQIEIWRQQNHEARLFLLSPDLIRSEDTVALRYGPSTKLPLLQPLSRTISLSSAVSNLIHCIQDYQPDLIYMRHIRYRYPLHRIFKSAPVVLELNSDDINESRHLGRPLFWFHCLTRGLLLSNAAGLIAVSHEIARLPSNQKYGKPTRVIANGIKLDQYHLLPAPKNSRPVITLVGSPGMAWHGVDKLICLARMCPDLDIHIIGYQTHDFSGNIPTNVQIHGFLEQAGVMDILAKSDVACGSLALHRKHMQEASPLKVREAAAYGIPIMLGYHDTDLIQLESECILQLPNAEDNVLFHVEQIRSFAYNMMGKRLNMTAIRNLIDQGHKEDIRLAFFNEIVKNGH